MSRKSIAADLLFHMDPRDPFGDNATRTMLASLHEANKRQADKILHTGLLDQFNQFFCEHDVHVTLQGAISMDMGLPSPAIDVILTFQFQRHSVIDIMKEFVAATNALVDPGDAKYGNVVKVSIAGQICNLLCVWDYMVDEWVYGDTYVFAHPPVHVGAAQSISFIPDHFALLQQMSIKIKESDPAYVAFFLTKTAVPNLCSAIIMWMVILSNNNAPHAFSIMHHMLANMKAVAANPETGLFIFKDDQMQQIALAIPTFVAFLKKMSLVDHNDKPILINMSSPVSKRMCSTCIDLAKLLDSDLPARLEQ